jgi:hypothetical protein
LAGEFFVYGLQFTVENDSLDHSLKLLIQVGYRISVTLRSSDTVKP